MAIGLQQIFSINKDDENKVLWLLLQSLALGLFYGAFDISAHTDFLNMFGEKEVPGAYVISGLIGIVITAVYGRFQAKIKFSTLSIYSLYISAIIVLLLWLSYTFISSQFAVYTSFLLLGPLNIVAAVNFWGTASRVFSIREAKKLFGLIAAGQVFGVILISFGIPLIYTILPNFLSFNLLLISIAGLIFAAVCQVVLSSKYRTELRSYVSDKKSGTKEKSILNQYVKNRYVLLMISFVVLSMIIAFFVQYAFLRIIKIQYTESNLAQFLGVFTGTLMIFGFLVKTFLYDKLMKNYGLDFTLRMLPIILIVITSLSLLSGTMLGYTPNLPNAFLIFFLLISLNRLMSLSLRDAIEIPSFKLLYQSLPEKVRYQVQVFIDGTINETAALVAGLLLLVITKLEVNPLVFNIILLLIIVLWLVVTIVLIIEYKKSLLNAETDFTTAETAQEAHWVAQIFAAPAPLSEKTFLLTQFERNNFEHYKNSLNTLLQSANYYEVELALKKIKQHLIVEYIENESISQSEIIKTSSDLQAMANVLNELVAGYQTNESIEKAIKSNKLSDRIEAAAILAFAFGDISRKGLQILIRDYNAQVVYQAIVSAGIQKLPDLQITLFEMLNRPNFAHLAFDSLKNLPDLDRFEHSYKVLTVEPALKPIFIRLYAYSKPEIVRLPVLEKLQRETFDLLPDIVATLKNIGFKATENEQVLFIDKIKELIGVIAWNFNIEYHLQQLGNEKIAEQAVHAETEENINLLFELLKLAYSEEIISKAQNYFLQGSIGSIGYALELLDLFLSPEMKNYIFPVVDNLLLAQRVAQLSEFFALPTYAEQDVYYAVFNRSPLFIKNSTKAALIFAMANRKQFLINDRLIALLFNPNPLIHQVAAIIIRNTSINSFYDLCKRLPTNILRGARAAAILPDTGSMHLMYNQFVFLRSLSCFEKTTEKFLLEIVSDILVIDLIMNAHHAEKFKSPVLIIGTGSSFTIESDEIFTAEEKVFYKVIESKKIFLTTKYVNSSIFFINIERLSKLLFKFPEFSNRISALIFNSKTL